MININFSFTQYKHHIFTIIPTRNYCETQMKIKNLGIMYNYGRTTI